MVEQEKGLEKSNERAMKEQRKSNERAMEEQWNAPLRA
jgi:hypothetical protein